MRPLKEARDLLIVIAIGALIIAGIGSLSGGRSSFGATFVYVVVGIVTAAVTMTATIMGIHEVAKRRGHGGESTAVPLIGYLLGLLVTTPIALVLVFRFL